MNYVVVGSGYGDEGKGLMTDFLVRHSTAKTVVRFNGGAQAGHTVHDGDKRYVFGHLAAGTLAGADTYLYKKFIINPRVLIREIEDMEKLGVKYPQVYANASCKITTIFDIAINVAFELSKGLNAHGSCGLGINETVVRHEACYHGNAYLTCLGFVKQQNVRQLAQTLKHIWGSWVPFRLQQLGITKEVLEKIGSNKIVDFITKEPNFIQEARLMLDALTEIVVDDDGEFHSDSKNVVFEGAQGLGLDEEFGEFPHVTRSRTGAWNAFQMMHDSCFFPYNFDLQTEVVYVTRAYATRHGNGPLHMSGAIISDEKSNIYDNTNIHNAFQGSIRFAPLNLHKMLSLISKDVKRTEYFEDDYSKVIALTCMDQLGDTVNVVDVKDTLQTIKSENLPQFIEDQLGLSVRYISRGPSAKDVEIVD